MNVGRRTAKIDLSTDRRDEESKETNENWDQEQLEGVVRTKHGAQHANETKIVCRHFLDAIEKSLYGWFWQCPNGGNQCQYRHALPTGYVYKTKAEREAEKRMSEANSISLEEVIEQEVSHDDQAFFVLFFHSSSVTNICLRCVCSRSVLS